MAYLRNLMKTVCLEQEGLAGEWYQDEVGRGQITDGL